MYDTPLEHSIAMTEPAAAAFQLELVGLTWLLDPAVALDRVGSAIDCM